jgi:2-oxoisovalerate dehydrogenase E1 component
LTIRGIKVVYPSNAADMKGLLKASFHDPNPVVLLEHKGLYWSKSPGTKNAKSIEPDSDYILPLGRANIVQHAEEKNVKDGTACLVVTYGMGVYWALSAAETLEERVTILDLRTLNPLDWEMIIAEVKRHNRVLVLTEEPLLNSFAESLAGRIQKECFQSLDAPVWTLGAENLPAVPLNIALETRMLPNPSKVGEALKQLLAY